MNCRQPIDLSLEDLFPAYQNLPKTSKKRAVQVDLSTSSPNLNQKLPPQHLSSNSIESLLLPSSNQNKEVSQKEDYPEEMVCQQEFSNSNAFLWAQNNIDLQAYGNMNEKSKNHQSCFLSHEYMVFEQNLFFHGENKKDYENNDFIITQKAECQKMDSENSQDQKLEIEQEQEIKEDKREASELPMIKNTLRSFMFKKIVEKQQTSQQLNATDKHKNITNSNKSIVQQQVHPVKQYFSIQQVQEVQITKTLIKVGNKQKTSSFFMPIKRQTVKQDARDMQFAPIEFDRQKHLDSSVNSKDYSQKRENLSKNSRRTDDLSSLPSYPFVYKQIYNMVEILSCKQDEEQTVYEWKVKKIRRWFTISQASQNLFDIIYKYQTKLRVNLGKFLPKNYKLFRPTSQADQYLKIQLQANNINPQIYRNRQHLLMLREIFEKVIIKKVSEFQIKMSDEKSNFSKESEYILEQPELTKYIKHMIQVSNKNIKKQRCKIIKNEVIQISAQHTAQKKQINQVAQSSALFKPIQPIPLDKELIKDLKQLESNFDVQFEINKIIEKSNRKVVELSCLDGNGLGIRNRYHKVDIIDRNTFENSLRKKNWVIDIDQ